MKLAELAGLSLSAQTTFATAVSEVAREVIDNGMNGHLVLGIHTSLPQKSVAAYIYDQRTNLSLQVPALQNARKLVNRFQFTGTPEMSCIEMYYNLPSTARHLDKKVDEWKEQFNFDAPLSPYDEIKRKNEQLQELADRLKASESQYRVLTNSLPLIIFTLNSKGSIIYANNWMQVYTGFTPEQINTANWKQVVHPEDYAGFYSLLGDIVATQAGNLKIQCRIREAHGGQYVWHQVFIAPLQEVHRPDDYFIGYIVDIHAQKEFEQASQDNQELKKTQQKLKENEQELTYKIHQLNRSNNDLEQFAYIASHDLQEPVRKMIFYSDYFNKQYAHLTDNKGTVYLNNMLQASHRMRNLINDLLSYSKIRKEATVFEQVNLTAVATVVLQDLELVIREKQAVIRVDDLPVIEGDFSQLSQVFQNMISNALKYSKAAEPLHLHIYSVSDNQDMEHIHFHDNGIGFDTKYLPKMFTLFQRLHGKDEYEGTGFGLAICKKIVDLHSGVIDAVSQADKGADFIVSLPVTQNKNSSNAISH
jgi:PAS domain S-box-containing protein